MIQTAHYWSKFKQELFSITTITILISAQVCAQSEPVHGAAYAEIRGVPGGWIRIYQTTDSHYNRTANILSKLWNPKLYFFDREGRELTQEEFTDGNLLDRSSDSFKQRDYEKVIKAIQSRLTDLPQVDHAGVARCIKGPGQQWIELFDKKGLLITTVSRLSDHGRNFDELVHVGDPIPQNAIDLLKNSVHDADILYSLKITKNRCFPEISVTGILFRK